VSRGDAQVDVAQHMQRAEPFVDLAKFDHGSGSRGNCDSLKMTRGHTISSWAFCNINFEHLALRVEPFPAPVLPEFYSSFESG
jgi:hypothetical protein